MPSKLEFGCWRVFKLRTVDGAVFNAHKLMKIRFVFPLVASQACQYTTLHIKEVRSPVYRNANRNAITAEFKNGTYIKNMHGMYVVTVTF